MRRGDIVWADFEPAFGSEADKVRPAVIVSSDRANQAVEERGRGVITVVPLTSRTSEVYRYQVLLPPRRTGLRVLSKAQTEQIRSLTVERVGDYIGRVPQDLLAQIDDAIRFHLSL